MRKKIIELLGGFPDLESAIEHIKKIDDREKKAQILSEAVKKLYTTIGSKDILRVENGTWFFQDRPLTGAEVAQLKEEAVFILGMKLWRIIKMDIRYQLGKKMFEEARVPDDILWGQLLTYLDDIIRARLQQMK